MRTSRDRQLNTTDIMMLAITRGMLGAGIGLLAADKLSDAQRRVVGRTLVLVGAVTTVPLAIRIFGRRDRSTAIPA